MVFLFGGRFRYGSNRNDLFGSEFVLLEDIILVLPNCRVGLLGFLSLQDSSLDVPGNAAFKDQVLALQWVRNNINKFGGDPNNVTLAGHSSGAMAVHYHVVSPLSTGLFHKAIIMSGSVFWTWAERSRFSLEEFASILNIKADTEKEILHCLQNLPADVIIRAQQKYISVSVFIKHIYLLNYYIFYISISILNTNHRLSVTSIYYTGNFLTIVDEY